MLEIDPPANTAPDKLSELKQSYVATIERYEMEQDEIAAKAGEKEVIRNRFPI